MSVYDAANGARIAGPVDRAQFGASAWSDDSATLYFVRLKQLAPGDAPTEKYKDATAETWDLKSDPVAVLGSKVGHGPPIAPTEFPVILMSVGAPMAAALSINGVQNELAMWLAPAAKVSDPATAWAKFITREDEVTFMDMRGPEIFLLSHKNAPTFQVLALHADQPLSKATTLVPAQPDRVIESIHAASDALYVFARHGAYSQLLRVPAGTTNIEEIALPVAGHVGEAFTDPRTPGVTIALSSWVTQPTLYAYDPASKSFADLKIGTRGDIDPTRYVVSDLRAKAGDGVMVPLSLVQPKDAKGAQITIVEAYGSYGISSLPISARGVLPRCAGHYLRRAMRAAAASSAKRGASAAGREQAQHLGRSDRLWRHLIARGITAKDKLFIIGGSAGGITMGRALTERPDLFAGVLDLVPAGNTLRAEFSPNGPPNIPEFGTVTTQEGFKNLTTWTRSHVRKGTQYPAVMVTTGSTIRAYRRGNRPRSLRPYRHRARPSRCCCASTRKPATASARPRHKPMQSRRLDRVRVLARRSAGVAAEALNRDRGQDSYFDAQP